MKNGITPIDEFFKLKKNPPHNKGIRVYDIIEDKKKDMTHTTTKRKYTLNQVGETVDKLVIAVADLTKFTRDSFKQVNTRLDYIVKANNLKDLPANK